MSSQIPHSILYHDTLCIENRAFKDILENIKTATYIQVDFDLLAVFILLEIGDLTKSIQDILPLLLQFPLNPCCTALQQQLTSAAKDVSKRLQIYHQKLSQDPHVFKPYIVRYPTLKAVLKRTISIQARCAFDESNKMTICLDEAGICVAISLPPPPFRSTPSTSDTPTTKLPTVCPVTRAYATLKDLVTSGLMPKPTLSPSETPSIHSPYHLLTMNNNNQQQEDSSATFSAQSVGYNTENDVSEKISLNEREILVEQLQGTGETWKQEVPTLPDGGDLYDGNSIEIDTAIRHELLYFSRVSYTINRLFLPDAVKVAEAAVTYLKKNGDRLIFEAITADPNPISCGRTLSVNMQDYVHRDEKNSLLFDSVFFFGDHDGGDFVVPMLGRAFPAKQGYSFHGPLKILLHGASKIRFDEGAQDCLRFSVTMWSKASTYSAVARHAAYRAGNQVYSDSSYWLPIYKRFLMLSLEKEVVDMKEEMKYNKKKRKRN